MIELKDVDIRPILFEHFEQTNEKLRIFEEFNIGRSRADALMVCASMGGLIGLEIKSDRDSLDRLSRQIKDYDKFCNKNYIVVGNRLIQYALSTVPAYWGVLNVYVDINNNINLEYVREAVSSDNCKLNSQLLLLWRSEMISIMKRNNIKGYSTRNKSQIVKLLKQKLSNQHLISEICEELMERDYTLY